MPVARVTSGFTDQATDAIASPENASSDSPRAPSR